MPAPHRRHQLRSLLTAVAVAAVLPLATGTSAGASTAPPPPPPGGAAPAPGAARATGPASPATAPTSPAATAAGAAATPAVPGPLVAAMAAGSSSQFVRRAGDQLVLGGRPYRFAGSNNYYPMYSSPAMVDALFAKAAAADFDVLRVWGSREIGNPDGSGSVDTPQDGFWLQYWDAATSRPAYNDGPDGIQRLDRVLATARAAGVRLVIPLVNNWNNFGGMDQYVRWAGKQYHDDFYTDATIRGWYKAWISHVLDRVNPLTGIAYKNDPTVLMWELGNEPRCVGGGVYPRSPSGCTTDTIVRWADEMTTYLKTVDRSHLVGVGDEGFYAKDAASADWTRNGADGVDSLRLSALRNVDVMSFHLYPDGWGKSPAAGWGTSWITEHVRDARKLHKPAFLGEFGVLDKGTRNAVYKAWTDAFVAAGGTGELYWILSDARDDGTPYPDYDGFTVYCPSPVCTTLGNAGKLLRREARTFDPVADVDVLTAESGQPGSVVVTANDVAYAPARILPDGVDLDPGAAGRQASVTVSAGTFTAAADGTVTYTPSAGFTGRATLPYAVSDSAGRTSNMASITVIVKPAPGSALTLFSFEEGTEGWAEQSWDKLGGTVTRTTEFATAGTHGARIDSLNEWFGMDLGMPLDVSTRSTLKLDLQTRDVGTSLSVVLKTGEAWTWCQGPFIWYPAGQQHLVTADLLTGLSCEGGAPPDLRMVRGVYLYFNAGSFAIDNIRFE